MHIQFNSKNAFIFLVLCSFTYLSYLIWDATESLTQIEVDLKELISYADLAVKVGGHAIRTVFTENSSIGIYEKGQMDVGRPELLTKADLISNQLMLALLHRFPLLEVISEEKTGELSDREVKLYNPKSLEMWKELKEALSKFPSRRVPLSRTTVWIDPLDATQEFTEGLTKYVTVMTCVVVDGIPLFGVIHNPFTNETVMGLADFGVLDTHNQYRNNNPSPTKQSMNRIVLVSRSHAGGVKALVEKAFTGEDPPYIVESAGGAGYKTMRLIRNTGDIYLHTTTIKKWDICAGDAIIRAAGGALLSLQDGMELDYSMKNLTTGEMEEIHHGGFLMALRSPYSIFELVKKFI